MVFCNLWWDLTEDKTFLTQQGYEIMCDYFLLLIHSGGTWV